MSIQKLRCEYCGEWFDANETVTVDIPSAGLFRCPECRRWTEGV